MTFFLLSGIAFFTVIHVTSGIYLPQCVILYTDVVLPLMLTISGVANQQLLSKLHALNGSLSAKHLKVKGWSGLSVSNLLISGVVVIFSTCKADVSACFNTSDSNVQ